MKDKKFERVVEWQKRPDIFDIFVGSIFVIIGIVGARYWVSGNEAPFMFTIMLFNSMVTLCLGLWLFVEGLGKRRKEYWREIK